MKKKSTIFLICSVLALFVGICILHQSSISQQESKPILTREQFVLLSRPESIIRSLESLHGKTAVVLEGSRADRYLVQFPDISLFRISNPPFRTLYPETNRKIKSARIAEGLLAVKELRADAFVIDHVSLLELLPEDAAKFSYISLPL